MKRLLLLITVLLVFGTGKILAQDGYCMYNGSTTGGAGGTTVTVTTAAAFKTYATSSSKYIIIVSGTIDLGGYVDPTPNKTIQGANTSAKIIGTLRPTSNIIIRNLTITSPYGDGITLWGSTRIFITNVSFYDCTDGCCDINHQADYITVSWCKFYYVNQTDHCFPMILGGDPYDAPGNLLHVTLHHNWFAEKCYERMPAGSYSNGHIYNNYYTCSGNMYATSGGPGTHWRVENQYYKGVDDPLYFGEGGIMQISGNIYSSCTGNQFTAGNGSVGVPYSYSLTATASVPSIVSAGAGNVSSSSTSTITSGAIYSVIAKHSSKGLDVQDASTANGGNIQQYNYVGATNQQFRITSIDGTYYSIVNINSNKGLDVASSSTANGANIQQWNYSGQANQQFKFVSTGDGYYQIVNKNSGKCLDGVDLSTSNGANVQQYNCGSGANQRWKLNLIALKSAKESIEENITASKLVVYPSPSNDGSLNIYLQSDNENEKFDLEVYNIKGQIVYSNTAFLGSDNVTGLKPGIYMVRVKSTIHSFTRKVLIK